MMPGWLARNLGMVALVLVAVFLHAKIRRRPVKAPTLQGLFAAAVTVTVFMAWALWHVLGQLEDSP